MWCIYYASPHNLAADLQLRPLLQKINQHLLIALWSCTVSLLLKTNKQKKIHATRNVFRFHQNYLVKLTGLQFLLS